MEHGISLSRSKAQIGQKVLFAGFLISSEGVQMDLGKVEGIYKFPVPQNKTDLRSFFGLVNQFTRFAPDLSSALVPMRGLLKKGNEFLWLPEHSQAFEHAKSILTNENGSILSHFDPNLRSVLMTDASCLNGIGFCLVQYSGNRPRLVCCGSRFISEAESRYAVCELEALAIQWAIEKCHLYLFGIQFTILTDHKPLVSIFSRKNLDSISNSRIQRILLRISSYSYDIEWCPCLLYTSDAADE